MATEEIISDKKSITLPILSMIVWILTGIIYKLLSIIFGNINYNNCVFITSLALSIACGFTFINSLLKKANQQPARTGYVILNIVLLYASANGYQQGYAFFASAPDQKTNKAGFIIPFLDPRPWIPDKFLLRKNEALAADTTRLHKNIQLLTSENETLKKQLRPAPINNNTSAEINQLKRKIDELTNQLNKPVTGLNVYKDSMSTLRVSLTAFLQRIRIENDLISRIRTLGEDGCIKAMSKTMSSECKDPGQEYISRIRQLKPVDLP